MAVRRFERAAPNELWQMDYKGHFATATGRCHPLTVLDDHSRFALAIAACADERSATVQTALTGVFRRYGLPERMLMDNGAPWGNGAGQPWTALRLGCCAWASASATAVPTIRRRKARTSASIAPSRAK